MFDINVNVHDFRTGADTTKRQLFYIYVRACQSSVIQSSAASYVQLNDFLSVFPIQMHRRPKLILK